MEKNWTFGRKLAFGFAVSSSFLVAIGIAAYWSIYVLISTAGSVTHTQKVLEHVSTLLSQMKDAETGQRGYLLTGDLAYLEPFQGASDSVPVTLAEMRTLTADNANQVARMAQLETLTTAKFSELKRTIELRKSGHADEALKVVLGGVGKGYMDNLRAVCDQINHEEREVLGKREADADATSSRAKLTIVGGTVICLLFVIGAGVTITRSLTDKLGMAVSHVQSSSAELQAAATQQASGSREQASAMNEISTTISELLATSRQIAESAQRVAQIAEQTASGARAGDQTVLKAQESVAGIRRQVDLIVTHMLDLGKKSQQIGGILEIINELAEQTNILSINATIEAAGAGEAGKRFAVVADEIRKLADRVGGSTKEIRGLIEEIRAAVNTTVMTTEGGTKAVDAGARQFSDVAASFKEISGLVGTTTEAAREIELSTKQQSTAVEQINIAVSNVAQATRETEASSIQTLQTASELKNLSRDLMRLIQPQAAA